MSYEQKGYGINAIIVNAAFQKVNVDVSFEFFPPARVFETTKTGKVDGAVGWVWSEEREQWFYFSDPFLEGPLVFFHLKSYPFDWKTYDDLKGIPIGIVQATAEESEGWSRTYVVRPFVQPGSLSHVVVLVGAGGSVGPAFESRPQQ